nr:MAG TPA: hypothetical protein [Caudoviricetes sp.]
MGVRVPSGVPKRKSRKVLDFQGFFGFSACSKIPNHCLLAGKN